MTPRHRKNGRRGWPENLYQVRKNGKTYYKYRDPRTRRDRGMGSDFKRAAQAARILNAKLMSAPNADHLITRVLSNETTVDQFLKRYRDEILPAQTDRYGRRLSDATLTEYQRIYTDAAHAWKGKALTDLRRRDIVRHLEHFPTVSANRRRSRLNKAFARAVADGLIDHNPVEGTIAHTEVVERERLTLDGFLRIREHATPWFRNALNLAIITLQRREDLVAMRFDHIENDVLHVRQQKVEGYGTGLIKVTIGHDLEKVISSCRDNVVSPFLIHRSPRRRRREYLEQKMHWTQVSKEMLTREFKKLRDTAGIKAAQGTPPTFQEIRALGAELYRQAGWPEEAIQRLLGHSSSKMTTHYLRGHTERWVEAKAGLQLDVT